jgi:3-phosphoshikimate 1-carboxyvinyltransferase
VDLRLENVNLCGDVKEMLSVFDGIGKKYEVDGDRLYVCRGTSASKNIEISIAESGTCLRFVLTYFAFADLDSVTVLLGERLAQRPILPLIECLNSAGADIRFQKGKIYIKKKHKTPEIFNINSSESSQFLTSIMMFASSQKRQAQIVIDSDIASGSYIQMTKDVIKMFEDTSTSLSYRLDPDYSTACYYWFYSYLLRKPVFIEKIGSIFQPDYKFLGVLEQLGIRFIENDACLSINPEYSLIPSSHSSLTFDMKDMPDQIITLSFLLLDAGIKAQIKGCSTLFLKESDRIAGIIENIRLLGGNADYADDTLTILPPLSLPSDLQITLKTFKDHRFAMTFLALQQKFPLFKIDDTDCIKKSFEPMTP